MSEDEPRRSPTRTVLFVCTGNTCRSPLAEGLATQLLAERLGCAADELAARGWAVTSAGVAAVPGDAPSAEAVAVAAEFGVELGGHRSRPLTAELLSNATDVVAVSRGHAAVLAVYFAGVGPVPTLLGGPDGDLPDPIGGDEAEYRRCAEAIRAHLARHLAEWLGP